jgi:hypothetical protein
MSVTVQMALSNLTSPTQDCLCGSHSGFTPIRAIPKLRMAFLLRNTPRCISIAVTLGGNHAEVVTTTAVFLGRDQKYIAQRREMILHLKLGRRPFLVVYFYVLDFDGCARQVNSRNLAA